MTTAFEIAWKLHTLGFTVLPIGRNKKPMLETWVEYQNGPPSDETVQGWQEMKKPLRWAIVCNDDHAVIDADTPRARSELEAIFGRPHITTPRGGAHWHFDTTGHPLPTRIAALPGTDVKAARSYAIVTGPGYDVLTLPTLETLIPYDRIPQQILAALGDGRKPPLEEGQPIKYRTRNATLVRIAGAMRRQGTTEDEILPALETINAKRCEPPLPDAELRTIARSVMRYTPTSPPTDYNILYENTLPTDTETASKRFKSVSQSVSLSEQIRAFMEASRGWVSYKELDNELGVFQKRFKDQRRLILFRLKEEGIIEAHSTRNGLFRFIRTETRLIDFKKCGHRVPLAVRYPFKIERLFNTYPGNLIVLAGDADAGKTAFLLDFIRLNMADFAIYYQSSEMGAEELATRLEKFEGLRLEDWTFTAEERSFDLADVTRPDCVNIYDYMEFEAGRYFEISDKLRAIHDKLRTGIAIVAIQKKRGLEIGRGGDLGLEKPRLYLGMAANKLTIVKAKNWANPDINPNRMILEFKVYKGCRFTTVRDWHKEEDGQEVTVAEPKAR